MLRITFERFDGTVWQSRALNVRALTTDRDDADMLTVWLADGRCEHHNPVRNILVRPVPDSSPGPDAIRIRTRNGTLIQIRHHPHAYVPWHAIFPEWCDRSRLLTASAEGLGDYTYTHADGRSTVLASASLARIMEAAATLISETEF